MSYTKARNYNKLAKLFSQATRKFKLKLFSCDKAYQMFERNRS